MVAASQEEMRCETIREVKRGQRPPTPRCLVSPSGSDIFATFGVTVGLVASSQLTTGGQFKAGVRKGGAVRPLPSTNTVLYTYKVGYVWGLWFICKVCTRYIRTVYAGCIGQYMPGV